MKNKFICGMIGFLIGCGPNRDFEDKNVFGSQTVGSTSSVTSSSSSTGGSKQTWPQENSGYKTGQVLPDWLLWKGYPEGITDESGLTNLPVSSWYDPIGSNGINAILFLTSKYNCSACAKESDELSVRVQEWNKNKKGIKVVILLINNQANGKPDYASGIQWKSQYGLNDVTVGIDFAVTFATSSTFSTPVHTIVDPRTMKIIDTEEGYSGDYTVLEGLADANK